MSASRLSGELQAQVIEFHQIFDHPIAESPAVPPEERVRFRARLIAEEFLESIEALFGPNSRIRFIEGAAGSETETIIRAKEVVQQARVLLNSLIDQSAVEVDLALFADGLADLDYVVEGSRLEFGIEGGSIAREVQRSNMAKAALCPACIGGGDVSARSSCTTCGGRGRVLLKRQDGKTLKPKGWTPPDIAGVLEKQKAEPLEYGIEGILADLQDGGDS